MHAQLPLVEEDSNCQGFCILRGSKGLRGPAAILFKSDNTCSEIAPQNSSLRVWFFVNGGGIAILSRDILQNGGYRADAPV